MSAALHPVRSLAVQHDLSMLIGVGYEKSGTSTLAATLATDRRFSVHPKKESFHFSTGYETPSVSYLSQFDQHEETKYLVDFTPSYIRSVEALSRIKRFILPTKIIMCLRNPIRRAYSHYVHNIYLHHAHYDAALPRYRDSALYEHAYNLSFAEELEHPGVIRTLYSESIELAYSMFGVQNVLILILERDFQPEILNKKLSDFLETEVNITALRTENLGGIVPTIACPADSWRLQDSKYAADLKNGNVYIFMGAGHGIACWADVPDDARKAILDASHRWSCYVPATTAAMLRQKYFDDDTEKVEQLLHSELPEWRADAPLLSGRWFGPGPLRVHRRGVPAAETLQEKISV
jgi:Sulfotransferase domain